MGAGCAKGWAFLIIIKALLKNKSFSAMKSLVKLLASCAVTEVRGELRLDGLQPTGAVKTFACKPQLIVDLHYIVNQHLRSHKVT